MLLSVLESIRIRFLQANNLFKNGDLQRTAGISVISADSMGDSIRPRHEASTRASKVSVISAALPRRWIWMVSIVPSSSATAMAARASRQPNGTQQPDLRYISKEFLKNSHCSSD